jgi:hypothetical protein
MGHRADDGGRRLRRPTPAAAGHEDQLTPDRKVAPDRARLIWRNSMIILAIVSVRDRLDLRCEAQRTERARHVLANDTGDDIARSTGREWHDHGDRTRRIGDG